MALQKITLGGAAEIIGQAWPKIVNLIVLTEAYCEVVLGTDPSVKEMRRAAVELKKAVTAARKVAFGKE